MTDTGGGLNRDLALFRCLVLLILMVFKHSSVLGLRDLLYSILENVEVVNACQVTCNDLYNTDDKHRKKLFLLNKNRNFLRA